MIDIGGCFFRYGISECFFKCRKCFGTVVKMRDAVKCKDCGWIDDRKLALDFGKSEFLNPN